MRDHDTFDSEKVDFYMGSSGLGLIYPFSYENCIWGVTEATFFQRKRKRARPNWPALSLIAKETHCALCILC